MLSSLLTVWKDLFALFVWKNGKLLLLGALNTFFRSVKLVIQSFWWLLILIAIAKWTRFFIVQDLLTLVMSFYYLLIVRPTIERKDYSYYIAYLQKLPLYLFTALTIIVLVFIPYKVAIAKLALPLDYPGSLVQGPFSIVCIAGLFFLDSSGSLRSVFLALKSTLKFVAYSIPLLAVIFLFEYCAVYYTVDVPFMLLAAQTQLSLKMHVVYLGLFIVRHLLTILLFSSIATLYIRMKHAHHKLFFT